MASRNKIENEIEVLVQEKKATKARSAIREYIRKNGATKNNLFMASQWFRRLSLYKEGLRLLMQLSPFDPQASEDVKIRTAEFLSIMGANPYALKLVTRIQLQTTEDYEVVAGIYFAANEYGKALEHFQKRLSLMSDLGSYEARLSRLSCADCLVQIGSFKEAISIGHQLLKDSKEPLFIAICQQAIGEYLARSGRAKEALIWIKKSAESFPGKKETYDHALLERWKGYILCKLGRKKEGKRHFALSTKIIKKIGLREEIWLDNLKLEAELGLLSKSEALRIHYFPGVSKSVMSRPAAFLFLGSRQSIIKINLDTEEHTVKSDCFIGLPLELRLLAYLRIAESWGIGYELLKVLLWPDEPNSYLFLEARLTQLVHRLKKTYNISLLIKNKRAYLRPVDLRGVSVTAGDSSSVLSRMGSRFLAQEFRESYKLKKTQSILWLNKYLAEGKIQRIQNGPQTFYIKTRD